MMTMSLFRLPKEVRLAIYTYACAPSIGTPHCCGEANVQDNGTFPLSAYSGFCTLHTRKDLSDIVNVNLNHRPTERRPSLSHNTSTLSLLLSCSAVYTELAHHIYSNWQIVIRAKDDASLAALSRLRASSIHALKRLTIDLNATSCGDGWECDDEEDPDYAIRSESEALESVSARENTQRSYSERTKGHLSPLAIFDYSRSQSLTVTNRLHKVSAEYS
jgi:hypothetical protein